MRLWLKVLCPRYVQSETCKSGRLHFWHFLRQLACSALFASFAFASPAFARWQLPEFLILFSYGFPAEQVVGKLTSATAHQIAMAHYNTVMCEPSQLDLVAKANLRCLLIGRSSGPPDYIGAAVSSEVARSLAGNPTVWGYFILDEPDNKNVREGATFKQLSTRLTEYRSADPNHVPYINVSSANCPTLCEYMDVVKPDFLSFDVYRWWARESDWWRNLEAFRIAALNAGVPLLMWLETNTDQKRATAGLPPPEDNAVKMRWCVYTSLAYGSKGVQWFIPSISADVADLNVELTALGPTLIGLESKQVFHTSDVPQDGKHLPESSWYHTSSPKLLIGEFVNHREAGAAYLLLANKSIVQSSEAVLDFNGHAVSLVEEINKRSPGRTVLPLERTTRGVRVRLSLAAGDGRLIRVQTR